MDTVEDTLQKKRFQKLSWLAAAVVFFWIAFLELSPYLPQSRGFDWWFWLGNTILAVAMCSGVLLSFWWASNDIAKRKAYFFFLCFFLFCFLVNSTRGLLVSAAASEFMTEFQDVPGSCKVESAVCLNFVTSANIETRQQWASTFFGISGINLLGNRSDGSSSAAPTDTARNSWERRQRTNGEMRETIRTLAQVNSAAINVFTLNALVGIFVLGFGGWWLGRRRTS
ncbi:MAG: hypothetical protein IPP88_06040 [Betaproteobacteria bacterium]|nr:hypothetical protein [Betaproteobacteria bacterium]